MTVERKTFCLLVGAALLLPAGAQAQCPDNEYTDVVRGQAVVAGVMFASQGYDLVGVYCGAIDEGDEESYTSSISRNARVAYVGVCDQDCSDLDLLMYEGDELVARDRSRDDVPIIRYRARQGGDDFRIVARMYACSVEPCYYAVAMYKD